MSSLKGFHISNSASRFNSIPLYDVKFKILIIRSKCVYTSGLKSGQEKRDNICTLYVDLFIARCIHCYV